MTPEQWSDPEGRSFGLRRAIAIAPATASPPSRSDAPPPAAYTLELLLFNSAAQAVTFSLPQADLAWQIELESEAEQQKPRPVGGPQLEVGAHSIAVLSAHVGGAST